MRMRRAPTTFQWPTADDVDIAPVQRRPVACFVRQLVVGPGRGAHRGCGGLGGVAGVPGRTSLIAPNQTAEFGCLQVGASGCDQPDHHRLAARPNTKPFGAHPQVRRPGTFFDDFFPSARRPFIRRGQTGAVESRWATVTEAGLESEKTANRRSGVGRGDR